MIIRLSQKNDIDGIVSLWHEAFGDEDNEIMFFINRRYVPENTLIAEENGKIASMLFLLDGKMCIEGVDYPSYYLYAACTLKEFRGRGLMAMLLEEAKKVADSRGYDYICLMPGEKSLFDFYKKHGYKTVFSKKVLTLEIKEDIIDITDTFSECIDFENIRNKAFANFDYFKWDGASVKFASDHNKFFSGNEFSDREGYCLYSATGDVMHVKEFAFTDDKLADVINKIAGFNNYKKAIVNLPVDYKTDCGEYFIQPSAMMLAVNEKSSEISKNLSNAYLGLTLD